MVADSNDNSCNFKTGFRIVIIKINIVILTKIFFDYYQAAMISKMALVVMDGNHNDWEQQKFL